MQEDEFNAQIIERFKALPKQVQEAITSADVAGHLRTLADRHKLHLDQWAILENEVMLAMLGVQKVSDLAKNIAREVGIQQDAAEALAADISSTVFAPIRAELERLTPADDLVEEKEAPKPHEEAVIPPKVAQKIAAATPPRPTPEEKNERAPISNTYGASTPSHERKAVDGDPYREQIS